MADRAAWERGLLEKRWQRRLAHARAIAQEASTSPLPQEAALGQRILAALDGTEPSYMVAVHRDDLDIVLGHAGGPHNTEYLAAARRIRDGIERGGRG